MIKRTEAQWRALFTSFDQSGLSAAAFCAYYLLSSSAILSGGILTTRPLRQMIRGVL